MVPIEKSTQSDDEVRFVRFRFSRVLAAVLLTFAFAVAGTGCGAGAGGSSGSSTENAPEFGALVSEMLEAAESVKSAHYVVDATLAVESDGEVSDPMLSAFAQNPLSIHAEGDVSETAFTASGNVSFLGQTLSGEIMGDENEIYINFLGTWYGSTDAGFADAAQGELGFEAEGGTPTPEELLDQLDQVVTGEITEGPDVDGAATWRVEGRLNSESIAELAGTYGGETLPAEALVGLDALADATTLVLIVGREDSLPRSFEMTMDLSADDLAEFSDGEAELSGLRAFKLEVTGSLSDFGSQVAYEAPESFEPIEELLGQFGGLDLGSEFLQLG